MSTTLLGQERQLAFPGAEGYGRFASGGRGGKVVEVTDLRDRDLYGRTRTGTLRAALETPGDEPLTIVFRVSGNIELSTDIKVKRSNLTIAGQTAPGDGICIKNASVFLSGENIIIRYVRFRPGAAGAATTPLNIENSKNIIVDHCSFSWAVEETMGMYDNKYTTVQWSIISEGLYNAGHGKGARGYGSQWGGQYASYHHNLIAHQNSRSPRINGSRSNDTVALVDFRNNVIYNWGSRGAVYGGENEIWWEDPQNPGQNKAGNFTNVVNNYYKPGPATAGTHIFAAPSYVTEGNTAYGYGKWYFSGNYMHGVTGGMNEDNWLGVDTDRVGGVANIRSNSEFAYEGVQTQTAQEAFNLVLENAGAILPKRDAVDTRIVNEVRTGTAVGTGTKGNGIIDSPTAVGGWPTLQSAAAPVDTDKDGIPDTWETTNNLDPNNAEDAKVIGTDGYTPLERYLNSIVPSGVTAIGDEVAANDFVVYPNPVTDKVFFSSTEKIAKVALYDLSGKVLVEKSDVRPEKDFLQVSQLKGGFYILRTFFRNGHTADHKLIKQ
ncbi:T9SS type A sorting domain-containing protein [Botryobacter ruber]|uniref:T9SS type A sorting domain-containing protein n=1 Tax=Botryobacter ruber TaxID=2171629 RepID=UPI000F64D9BA|nr:T9SS type A sorting domain-containing protein [Botryobacter ruber]